MRTRKPADYPGCPATAEQASSEGRVLVETRWGLGDSAICLIGTWVLGLTISLFLAFLAANGLNPGFGVALVFGAATPWLVLAGWPLVATRRWGNGAGIDLGLAWNRQDIAWGVLGGVVAYVLGLGATLLTEAFFGGFDSAAGDAATRLAGSGPSWQLWIFAGLVLIGAPLAEELAFRGLLFASLARSGLVSWAVVLLTSFLFAAFHFEPVRFGVLFVVGLCLGWLRLRTGRLGAPIIAHAVNNLPGTLAILALA